MATDPMKYLVTALSILALHVSAVLFADEEPRFTHARFVEGERSMQSQIRFPDIDGDTEVVVSCTGHATAKGRLKDARCSAPNDPKLMFTMAVSRRFNSVRLTPAIVNGRAEEVDFQFTVVFKKLGESETFDIYLHNMKNVERLGLNYIGAQRYSEHPWPGRCLEFTRDDLIMEVAIVNELGIASEFDVLAANFGMSVACRNGFATHLQNGKWIPAFHDGQMVESVWAQPRINMKSTFKRQQ